MSERAGSKRRTPQRRGVAVAWGSAFVLTLGLVAAPGTGASAARTGDNAIEKRAVLKKSDFSAGWESSTRAAPTDSGLDACAGIDAVNEDLAPRSRRSPNFTKPDVDNVLANNAVVVLATAKEAKGYLEPFRDESAAICIEMLTETSLTEADFSAARVYVTPNDDVPPGADDAVGFDVEITVTAPATAGQPARAAVIYEDLIIVRVGRALANFAFLNPGASLPEQGELVDAVIGRLEDALE